MADDKASGLGYIRVYLKQSERKGMLRFITCGAVGGGKTTLIGQLLNASHLALDNQPATDEGDSKKLEQHTRDMITGAATVEVAVILIDAHRGMMPQIRRHSYLASLIGIRKIVLAVNKMDLLDYSEEKFKQIVSDYREFAAQIGLENITPIPLSALQGDNILARSNSTDWYQGPTLIDYLESCEAEDEVDISPGDTTSGADTPAEVADQFECTLIWMGQPPLFPGRPYRLMIGPRQVNATVTSIKYRLDLNTLAHEPAAQLNQNDIAICNISLDSPASFEPYQRNKILGSITFVDRTTNQMLGAGMLHFALRRSHNIHRQYFDIDMAARAAQKGQKPAVLWFTGLSGAGKSTIANHVERQLFAMNRHSYLLDGDNVRHGLNRDLGFTDADRVENIRRVAEVAKLMADAGLIVLTAFISPFRAEREQARQLVGEDRFFEIFVNTPLSVAEKRDVKGLYKKARSGELKNFTGIDSPYEPPENPALEISTEHEGAEATATRVVNFLLEHKLV